MLRRLRVIRDNRRHRKIARTQPLARILAPPRTRTDVYHSAR